MVRFIGGSKMAIWVFLSCRVLIDKASRLNPKAIVIIWATCQLCLQPIAMGVLDNHPSQNACRGYSFHVFHVIDNTFCPKYKFHNLWADLDEERLQKLEAPSSQSNGNKIRATKSPLVIFPMSC